MFKTLAGAYETRAGGDEGKCCSVNRASMCGRYGADDNLRSRKRGFQFTMNSNTLGQFRAGEIRLVFMLAADRFDAFGIVHPKRNFVRLAAARKHNRQRRTPASRTENGDLCHSVSFFLPNEKRGSVPSTSRCRLPSCL